MRILLLSVLLLAQRNAAAQNNRPPVYYAQSISIAPLALLDVDRTFLLSGEWRLKKNLAFVTDAGLVLGSGYVFNDQGASGFTIRPGVRLYHGRRKKAYFQPQVFYKQVTYRIHDWLGKDCVNGVPAYEREQDFRYRKKVGGVNMIYGGILPLSATVYIDLYIGLGVRYKRQGLLNEPNSCYNLGGGFLGDSIYEEELVTPSVPAGIRLTFALR